MIKGAHINKFRSRETAVLYGPTSQDVRLEWATLTGGTLNAPNNKMVGAVRTINSLDVRAIWGPESEDKEKTRLDQNNMEIDQFGYWYFAKDLDLSGKPQMVILHKVKNTYYSGAGTTAVDVWTADVAPSWLVDQWQGHWLLFDDLRFEVLSNDANSLTVNLGGNVLPVGSNIGEIFTLVTWNPTRDGLLVPGGIPSPIGGELTFQSVHSSRQELIG